jgi:hypothetical protein
VDELAADMASTGSMPRLSGLSAASSKKPELLSSRS